jgi:hypothetical protein
VTQPYPDLSNIFAAKARRRFALAALAWEEKVAVIERMRTLLPKNGWLPATMNEKVSGAMPGNHDCEDVTAQY